MKKQLLFLLLSLGFLHVQGQPIFDSNIHTAVAFGDVDSPPAESAEFIIDQDSNTKFLDFNAADGIGFEVDLLGVQHIANAIEIVTANDAPERDPLTYEVFGSNNGTDYVSVATDSIPCVATRFLSRTFAFQNTEAYSFYRVNFTGTCATTTINQIADVQLYAAIGNAPVISCPGDLIAVPSLGVCGALITFDVTAQDAEDGSITATPSIGMPSGSVFPIGQTDVVFEAIDSDNNLVSCGFTITVIDETESPVLTCPEDITVTIGSGASSAVVDYDVSAADNCSLINPIDSNYFPIGTSNGKSYYLGTVAMTANDALIDAITLDGNLATIRNAGDNKFIYDILNQNVSFVNAYIGYNDLNGEGEFEWYSGEPVTYENWAVDEPNNSGPNGEAENYTSMQLEGKWNDVTGDAEQFYLVEMDFVLEQTEGLESGSDFPIGTTTNTFVTYDAAGNTTTCSFDVIVMQSTNVDEQALAQGITIAPNPTTDQVYIENLSGISLESIIVLDVHGKLMHRVEINKANQTQVVDMTKLSSGIYFLRIKGTKGIISKRIIKQ